MLRIKHHSSLIGCPISPNSLCLCSHLSPLSHLPNQKSNLRSFLLPRERFPLLPPTTLLQANISDRLLAEDSRDLTRRLRGGTKEPAASLERQGRDQHQHPRGGPQGPKHALGPRRSTGPLASSSLQVRANHSRIAEGAEARGGPLGDGVAPRAPAAQLDKAQARPRGPAGQPGADTRAGPGGGAGRELLTSAALLPSPPNTLSSGRTLPRPTTCPPLLPRGRALGKPGRR